MATVTLAAGTTSWTCPTGVTSILVKLWGGGGRGGERTTNGGGGGGTGGAYAEKTIAVVPGTVYQVSIGAGATTAGTTPGNGGDTWFSSNQTALAKGGVSVGRNSATGAARLTSGSIGDVTVYPSAGSTGSTSVGAAGSASPNGGAGGAQRTTQGVGSAGIVPGGGGGGALRTSANTQVGGAGADGQITITYTVVTAFAAVIERSRMSVTDRSRYAIVSNGGMTVEGLPGTGSVSHVRSISGRTSGKFVVEVTILSNGGNGFYMGFCEPSFDIDTTDKKAGQVGLGAGFNAAGVRFGYCDGYDTDAAFRNGGVSAWGDAGYLGVGPWQAASEAPLPVTYMLAIDLDRHRFAYRNAGGWVSDQDPANGIGYTTMIANAFFTMGGTDANTVGVVNFGQKPFVFPIPAGFSPWQSTVVDEPTASLSFVSAKAIASNDYQYGEWNFDSDFPSGEALLVIYDGEGNRTSTDLYVNGVKAQQYPQIGKPFFVYRLPDQGPAGTRSVTYSTQSYWNNLRFICLKPTGVDLSAPTNVTPGVFQYDDGTRTDLSLTVPAGGVGLALGENSTTEVGNRNRFLGWTKPLGSVIFDTTQTGLESTAASLDATSVLWFKSRQYGGTNLGGVSFAPSAVTPATPTRRPIRSYRFI